MQESEEISRQLQIFSSYLQKRGLRMTRQREVVADSFLQATGHLSAEELHAVVKARDSRVGFATVFRALKALKDCGLAREVHFRDGRSRFERLYKRPHHHHLVCVQCHGTIEFLGPELERLQEEIISRYHFKPLSHELEILGICRQCRSNRKTTQGVFDSDLVFARDALKIALEAEKRGVIFYDTAARMVSGHSTRSTFLRMLKDERRHLRKLQGEWRKLIGKDPGMLEAPVFLHFDYGALRRIFPSREEAGRKLKKNLTEEEALLLAMRMEREASNFFKDYASRFDDTRGRDIFLNFAAEEEEHYSLIKKAYDRLHLP